MNVSPSPSLLSIELMVRLLIFTVACTNAVSHILLLALAHFFDGIFSIFYLVAIDAVSISIDGTEHANSSHFPCFVVVVVDHESHRQRKGCRRISIPLVCFRSIAHPKWITINLWRIDNCAQLGTDGRPLYTRIRYVHIGLWIDQHQRSDAIDGIRPSDRTLQIQFG